MANLSDFKPLSSAEEKLISEAGIPDRTVIADGEIPNSDNGEEIIRAGLIRSLLLHELEETELHAKGIRLRGAKIAGSLDLQGCDCDSDISLSNCTLTDPINLVNAQVRGLYISSCQIAGMAADNGRFSGSLYIRSGTKVAGEISLAGARIDGDLQICDAQIESPVQDAVFAPSLCVDGSVFLGNYPYGDGVTYLETVGQLFFSSTRVGHDFFLTNTSITLKDNVLSQGIFGDTEEHGRDMAVSLARAKIGGILYLQDNQINRGILNLAGADVTRLKDEPVGPGAAYPIRLDGFRYKDFSRHADTSIKARLEWLARRPEDTEFSAQPYEQLAQVLAALGHRSDAESVLMRKEQLLRQETRRLIHSNGASHLRLAIYGLGDFILRSTVGYGYKPGRSVVVALVLIFVLGAYFEQTWKAGDMTPNSGPVLMSANWQEIAQREANPGEYWSQQDQQGRDWETFNAFAYAADLVIPLVSLGQEDAWAPSTSRTTWGWHGWWLRWFAKFLGWILTALGAAAITGLIRRD